VRTQPDPKSAPYSFSFVLSSCNLPVVRINDLMAFLLGVGGSAVAMSSLELPPERWTFPTWVPTWSRKVLGWLGKWLGKALVFAAGWFVQNTTGVRQYRRLLLRSPFVKLSAVFDSVVLELVCAASDGQLPGVGDAVHTPAGASGVVACSPTRTGKHALRVVLTQAIGTFEPESPLAYRVKVKDGKSEKEEVRQIGLIGKSYRGRPWYEPPSFFIHAGDQIYYDFPRKSRVPDRDRYRLAYVEAWSDDESARHVLAHWPHYMTLDDHEIADQFARDFQPPAASSGDEYLEKAMSVYSEYVAPRNPPRIEPTRSGAAESYWYQFETGGARFFVLDTRTQRFDHKGQIIDGEQMHRLLEWMKEFQNDVKFVVTSVPFVAEVHASEQFEILHKDGRRERVNPQHDKWSATRFRRQREQIIDWIHEHDISRLVFLTGDLHCCYHATMRIGRGSKYECMMVHELAGGPLNQLQLAAAVDFKTPCARVTARQIPYEVVLERFHSQVNAVMHVKVEYVERERLSPAGRMRMPEVEWNVLRTLTDMRATDWKAVINRDASPYCGEPTMTGRIAFVKRRTLASLDTWPTVSPTLEGGHDAGR
jgi:hypothetical protein